MVLPPTTENGSNTLRTKPGGPGQKQGSREPCSPNPGPQQRKQSQARCSRAKQANGRRNGAKLHAPTAQPATQRETGAKRPVQQRYRCTRPHCSTPAQLNDSHLVGAQKGGRPNDAGTAMHSVAPHGQAAIARPLTPQMRPGKQTHDAGTTSARTHSVRRDSEGTDTPQGRAAHQTANMCLAPNIYFESKAQSES